MEWLKWIWVRLPLRPPAKTKLKHWIHILLRLTPHAQQITENSASLPATSKQAWLEAAPSKRRDWIVFGIIGWSFRIQRPQHLSMALAASGDRVFFIEPVFINDQKPGAQVESLDGLPRLFRIQLNLDESPQIYFKSPSSEKVRQLREGMANLLEIAHIDSTIALVEHSFWTDLALTLPNNLTIYDCMDHHEGFGDVPKELLQLEHKLLRSADLVVVTSDWLHNLTKNDCRSTHIVRNACDYHHFSKPTIERMINPNPVVGYFGAIAGWFDVELVDYLAKQLEGVDFVLIGDDTVQAQTRLKKNTNVKLLGEQPYSSLPNHLVQFDVCLLPFLKIPLTLATNPVKVYEYLAMGKHVVCVNLPEVSQFKDLVWAADTHEDFLNGVKSALAAPPSNEQIRQRQAFAEQQTWSARAESIKLAVNSLSHPVISIVVLTFNRWDLTEQCLTSIFERTDYPGEIELIVADNGSSDETLEKLNSWKITEPRLKIVENGKNLGFSAGNNRGVAASRGDYVVILNNDTVVTRGWLLTMLGHFRRNPKLGLLGPVTNNIGNEAKIHSIHYNDLQEMHKAAKKHTIGQMGASLPLQTAAFFCVMLPRQVWETVGDLDENYGRGFFEDDDYCRRVELAGWEIACAEDVFVHHHLSATFNQVLPAEKQALFEKNKQYYESKWGPWIPHSYR